MPEGGRRDEIISIGDRSIRLVCTGAGLTTVVLEADAGEGAGSWSMVQARLSESLRVCSSDRSGYYANEGAPISGSNAAADLYQALQIAGETGPYLLVGHGEGSFVVRAIAEDHGDELVGMVLVDPQPDHFLEDAAGILPEPMLRVFGQGLAVPDGLQDLGRSVWDQDLGDLPLTIIGADTDLMFGPEGISIPNLPTVCEPLGVQVRRSWR